MQTLDEAHKLITERELERSVVITDARHGDNPIIYVTRAFLEATGYTAEEVVGRNPRFLQGPETDPAEVARIAEAITAAERIETTLRNYRKDGRAFWHHMTIRPSYNDAGDLEHFIAVQSVLEEEA